MTFHLLRADGNGTKQLGVALWWNSSRTGLQLNFWAWEIQIMKEHSVARWNTDKPHRCPACHAVAVPGPVSSWRVYTCCRCEQRFTRWPRLARLLPDVGVQCKEERHA